MVACLEGAAWLLRSLGLLFLLLLLLLLLLALLFVSQALDQLVREETYQRYSDYRRDYEDPVVEAVLDWSFGSASGQLYHS